MLLLKKIKSYNINNIQKITKTSLFLATLSISFNSFAQNTPQYNQNNISQQQRLNNSNQQDKNRLDKEKEEKTISFEERKLRNSQKKLEAQRKKEEELKGAIRLIVQTSKGEKELLILGVDGVTNGYFDLISNYDQIRLRMANDIKNGKGQQWVNWLRDGVVKNNSIYWWMWAEWLYLNNQHDNAYRAAVQAIIFTRLELPLCRVNTETRTNFLRDMLVKHQHIINSKTNQDNIKLSILESFVRTENHLKKEILIDGMSCNMIQLQNIDQKVRFNFISFNNDMKTKESNLRRQELETSKLKDEFSYQRIFSTSDPTLIWQAQNL